MRPQFERILIAHPSPDLYGSDRQLLVTIDALVEQGAQVTVVLPLDGPLAPRLREHGAGVVIADFPVLRKAMMSPRGLARLAMTFPVAAIRLRRMIRTHRPELVLVNTLTIPVWQAAAALARVPVVTHVHEAEEEGHRLVRAGLTAPLLASRVVITNSKAARASLLATVPRLEPKITVVHNGVPGPATEPEPPRRRTVGEPVVVALIARLSPRKGVDVAVSAAGIVAASGQAIDLKIGGSVFEGYEWYETQLRDQASSLPAGADVTLLGYVDPTWELLSQSDMVLVPSRAEPFGNTAVEALLARRPTVVSGVQGLLEIIDHGATGLVVPPDDPQALADAILELAGDPERAHALADAGFAKASAAFTPARYATAVLAALERARGRVRS